MAENFITHIFVEKSINVQNLDIPLCADARQHLILTGKNGSGKTSLLLEINKFLTQIQNGNLGHLKTRQKNVSTFEKQLERQDLDIDKIKSSERAIESSKQWFKNFGGVQLNFSNGDYEIVEKYERGEFLLAFFDSKRHINLNVPKGIQKVNLQKKYGLNEKANTNFIQYIVNLKADRSFAKDDGETKTVEKIDKWFEQLEKRLKHIFEVEQLKLQFDRKTYNFEIVTEKLERFSFDKLSDGHSAILSIVTEILLRMEAHEAKSYDLEGIVIIDEIETHLHVALQKKILPFLTDFFPKIQFIITTHSPFVLSSLPNATICDLETKIVTQDLSAYSYDALLESYFKTDKYSETVKNKVSEYEKLILVEKKTDEQRDEMRALKRYFSHAPKYLSKELLLKLQQLEQLELTQK